MVKDFYWQLAAFSPQNERNGHDWEWTVLGLGLHRCPAIRQTDDVVPLMSSRAIVLVRAEGQVKSLVFRSGFGFGLQPKDYVSK